MNYTKKTGKFPSANAEDIIVCYFYMPLEKPRAILQISHGMCEYIERYEGFIDFLTGNGILVCGNDHLGHGNSVSSDARLGFFAETKGWTYLSKDVHRLSVYMKEQYAGVPFFLLGHSMGSFVARAYIEQFAETLDGVILSGTSGGEPLGKIGLALANYLIKKKGPYYRSSILQKLAFGAYNKKYGENRTQYDWLCKDTNLIDQYIADKRCNFVFTVSGFRDLATLLNHVSSKACFASTPKTLPIFLISGDMDPVGAYGKGVKKVCHRYQEVGVTDLSLKLYKDGRHEMLNETNKEEVYVAILEWIETRIALTPSVF